VLLEHLRGAPVPPDLAAWAESIGGPADGDRSGGELFGTARRAGVYASLLWNGVRLVRSHGAGDAPALTDALVLLALTCGATPGSDRLDAAVQAGLAEERPALTSKTAVAQVTTWVLPAAASAVVCTGVPGVDASAAMDHGLRDVAAALMVVRVPLGEAPCAEPPGEGLLLGHALAAGWLATQLWEAGVVGVPQTFERTVAAVVGAP
jgi:hypothetical protein